MLKIQELNRIIRNIKYPDCTIEGNSVNDLLVIEIDTELKEKSLQILKENKDLIQEIAWKLLNGLTEYGKIFNSL